MTIAQIQNLGGEKSVFMFNHFDLKHTRQLNSKLQDIHKMISSTKVTNDAAERVVKMLSIRL